MNRKFITPQVSNYLDFEEFMPNQSILVIDDDENVRHSLAMILEKDGFRVWTAEGGCASLPILCAQHIDLVFLDITLPDVNGLSLIPMIRQMHPNLPILVLTATSVLDTENADIKKTDYLIKPIDPAVLLERVRQKLQEPLS